jgi:hypothetical protein
MSKANDNADTELFTAARDLVRRNFREGKTAAEARDAFERLYMERIAPQQSGRALSREADDDKSEAPS